jgi:haloalkane dehalogenase
MDALRTPDERFTDLPGYDFEPHYVDIGGLRMHYVDEGPATADPVLLLHGEPSWSYLYRKMIPLLVEAGHRVIAPDLIGFGKSDKPTEIGDYTYQRHVDWVRQFVEDLGLQGITLFGQDWGSLIGLRVAAENEERFARIVIGNGALPTGDHAVSEAFMQWREFAATSPTFEIGRVIQNATVSDLPDEVVAAYDAPFPDDSYKAGARAFPALVPIAPDDPASEANRRAWAVFMNWQKPFLTTFSDKDPILGGGEKVFKKLVPGAAGQPHVIIEDGGHFLQEDKGEEIATKIIAFIARGT